MTEVDRLYPYDPKLPLHHIRLYKGPDRLRWIADRALAQTLLDIWHKIEADEKRKSARREQRHWTEKEDAAE